MSNPNFPVLVAEAVELEFFGRCMVSFSIAERVFPLIMELGSEQSKKVCRSILTTLWTFNRDPSRLLKKPDFRKILLDTAMCRT